mmetsp:Transcript_53980/g.161549  ORF Transcript_53980/g.161549 Transcript_53980/m.161549 type:complete len:220 (+) Transcript_53980:2067-2726(+)
MRRDFPHLRCLCFGSPGFLFSRNIAKHSEEFVTSFIINSDLVPRISMNSMKLLRDEVLTLIARIKVPKREVVRLRLTESRLKDLPEGLGAFLFDEDEIPESDFSRHLAKFKDHLRQREEERGYRSIPMFPPGRIIHLHKTNVVNDYTTGQGVITRNIFNMITRNRFAPRDVFTPTHASAEDFNEIIVTKTLVSDHMIEYVRDALGGVAAEFGIDPSTPP